MIADTEPNVIAHEVTAAGENDGSLDVTNHEPGPVAKPGLSSAMQGLGVFKESAVRSPYFQASVFSFSIAY